MCRRLMFPSVFLLAFGLAQVQAQDINIEWIKAVYWDAKYRTNWASEADSVAVRDGLVAAGYELLNADQLKTWMQARIADKKYSVIVFARDNAPNTVVETVSASCTLRKYLDAGGKIVFYADIPFWDIAKPDGTWDNPQTAGATAILGFNNDIAVWDSGATVTITAAGKKWGLKQTWSSVRPIGRSVGVEILATDAAGNAAAWVRHYVKNDTFRGFVRIYDVGGHPPVADIISVAEFVGVKASNPDPADGAVGVTLPLLRWDPSSFAVFHNVYFGETPELTEANLVAPRTFLTMYYHMPGFEDGKTYYWRVDEITATGAIITGDVWRFMTEPLKAYLPSPADEAASVLPGLVLSWSPGKAAVGQHVFFGSDETAVANGDAAVDQGTITELTFKTPALRASTTYYWRVDTVKSGGSVPGDVWSFSTVDGGPTGKILWEWWTGIGGTAVSGLTSSANYPANPSGSQYVDLFQSAVDWADNYGQRLYGWLKPPETGDYTFWIAGDDEQQLWLSTDTNPANAEMIANVAGWTPAFDWDNTGGGVGGASQMSAPITLQAGQKYFILALGKEGGGGDSTAVAWKGGPIATREVIKAQYVDMVALLPLQAFGPTPSKGAVDVVQAPVLTWNAGEKATQHNVYFGDDANAVAAADTASGLFKGSITDTSYDAGDLEWGKTYYWRIDETDGTETWKGNVWSFTTANFIPIDDFESYNDEEGTGTRIYETWIDGYTDGLSGSTVGNLDPPFAEQTIVHGGFQSMPMDYNNVNSPYLSQAYREFSPVQNWTVEGVTDLSLWVRGSAAPLAAVAEVGGAMTVTGEGSDIWNNTDQFTYVYKTLSGDGSIVARVTSNGSGSNTWAKGGVMIRDSLAPGSVHGMMVMTGGGGNGASFQWRPTADNATTNTDAAAVLTLPYYVKIERTGDSIAAYLSANGTTWTAQGSAQYIAMTAPACIGICVTSGNTPNYRTFEFDNIKATGASGAWQTAEIGLTRNSQQPLYVIVEDSAGKKATAVDPNAAAVNATVWTEWKIPLSDLSGVNLTKVKKLYIGVGDTFSPAADGYGRIYIDDIRVTKP